MATWQHIQSGLIKETRDETPPEQEGWTRVSGSLETWEPDANAISEEEVREQLDYLVLGD